MILYGFSLLFLIIKTSNVLYIEFAFLITTHNELYGIIEDNIEVKKNINYSFTHLLVASYFYRSVIKNATHVKRSLFQRIFTQQRKKNASDNMTERMNL